MVAIERCGDKTNWAECTVVVGGMLRQSRLLVVISFESMVQLKPSANTAYTLTVSYIASVARLSQTNWLRCMVQAFMWFVAVPVVSVP